MKIGLWNLNKNKGVLEKAVLFAKEQDIDFLILLECILDPAEILLQLNSERSAYYYYKPYVSDFFQIFIKFSTDLLVDIRDEGKISVKQFLSPLGRKINFVIVHLPSKLYYDEADQDAFSNEVKKVIDEIENQTNCFDTVVLGDFNMNPFQRGMIQTTGFHSTFDKKTAKENFRIVQGKEYKYFYNPMWSFFGELGRGKVHGTFFYKSPKPICYFWNIFDQVLFRPTLLDSIFAEETLEIVTRIGDFELVKGNQIIDKKISDHLPIQFELNNI
ncbi:MAG: hypothetical protein JST87_12060 [Bacteroidetes bacterium]|nr:hypothetical protein [Bacteroidota bacterium]